MRTRVPFAVFAILCTLSAQTGRLEDGFRSPPDEARPHVWWHWMNGNVTRQDITAALGGSSAKEMKVEIRVTNLWPNRLIGDDVECAEDRELKKDTGFWDKGAIDRIPDWVRRGEKSPTGRCTFASWKHWDKDDDPLPSAVTKPVCVI